MSEAIDLEALRREVEREVRALGERLPEWAAGATYADPAAPTGALERRERERLERLERREHHEWRERTRERAARERTRPWSEGERFGLRKRVWSERRARERELLDRREAALLDRERELLDWLARHEGWLRDLAELDPASRAWRLEQEALRERGEVTPETLVELQRRRREAGAARARELLARDAVRAALCPAVAGAPRDPFALAPTVTKLLVDLATADAVPVPILPVLFAAVALELARDGAVERCAGDAGRSAAAMAGD